MNGTNGVMRSSSRIVSSQLIVGTSAIGTQESIDRTIQKAALGYESSIYTYDQARQVLATISQQQITDLQLYVHLLQVCAAERSLTLGRQVHEQLRKSGVETGSFIDNNLIRMYGRCGSPADAYSIFQNMSLRTVVSWTSMITAFSQNGHYKEGLKIYERMLFEGHIPNKVTFFTAVDACARGGLAVKAKSVAGDIAESEYHVDSTLATALVNMFGKCGDVPSARLVFDRIHDKTVVTWTALITTYVNHGLHDQALSCFEKMQLKLVTPNEITFVAAFNACAACEDVKLGRKLHAQAAANGLVSKALVGTALVNMYSKCGELSRAHKAFRMILEPDVVAYNAILAGYSEKKNSTAAFVIFYQMLLKGLAATKATFVSLLNACSGSRALQQVRFIHRFVEWENDTVVKTALLKTYGKCGQVEDAALIFSGMKSRNLVSWNTMLGVYAEQSSSTQAFNLYRAMQHEGVKPDGITFMSLLNSFTTLDRLNDGREVHAHLTELGLGDDLPVANAVLDMYGKCGSLKEAGLFLESMKSRNVISWTSVITAWFQQGKNKESMEFYHRMLLEGATPDRLTFVAVVNACAGLASLKEGRGVHESVNESGVSVELSLGTALVNMYGKCGQIGQAENVFGKMGERELTCWNSMIGAYSHHGHAREAVDAFRMMQLEGLRPDTISFVTLLSACRHAGLLEHGLECFASMTQLYGLEASAETQSSLIDLLGRTGHLDEAEKYVKSLRPPSAVAWTLLMDACRVHGDLERGSRVGQRCLEVDPDDHLNYVNMSIIYSSN